MTETEKKVHWYPFNGDGNPIQEKKLNLPEPPPWRTFKRAILADDKKRWNNRH